MKMPESELLSVEEYPDSDGEPIADNTLQFDWIAEFYNGFGDLFHNEPNVFIAACLFWYPCKGSNVIRETPDIMIALGRPKGHRCSYRQWVENNQPPQVVFEILSHLNRDTEMTTKFEFYEKYGVKEYYIVNPYELVMARYVRQESGKLQQIPETNGHFSPSLQVRFELSDDRFAVIDGEGRRFINRTKSKDMGFVERKRELAELEAETERLLAKLRAAGIDPDV